MTSAQETPSAATTDEATELDRVSVTGSRILRAGFDTLEPAAVITRETMEAYGHTNLVEALTSIPGLSAGTSYRGDQASFGAGVNFLSRFDLGSNRMLTLVNGRCFVTSTPPTIFGAGDGSGVQVDLNAIPSVMVERVETIGIGGTPTCGSDAISGVTNIILRDRFEGAEAEVGFGSTIKHDNNRRSFSAIVGQGFADGCGHLTLAAQYDTSVGRARASLTATEEMYRDSWTTWDANVSYRVSDAFRLNLSVINLGDRIGPFPSVLNAPGRR